MLEIDQHEIADWPAHKAAVEAFVLGHLEEVLPGARARIAVASSASAQTAWRFTWNAAGAMLGWEMSPDQLGDSRPANRGPLPNLWHVGHWTRPGGGITPVIVSAVAVAREVAGALVSAELAPAESFLDPDDSPTLSALAET